MKERIDNLLENNRNLELNQLLNVDKHSITHVLLVRVVNSNTLSVLSNIHPHLKMFNYGDSVLVLLQDNQSLEDFYDRINNYDYYVGVIKYKDNLVKSVKQAIKNLKIALFTQKRIVSKTDNTYLNVLVSSYHEKDYQEYMSSYFDVFIHDQEMVDTVLSFVQNNGDYKLCGKKLFCHENTIRYRIAKIKSMVAESVSDFEFYHNLSLAVNIYLLNKQTYTI